MKVNASELKGEEGKLIEKLGRFPQRKNRRRRNHRIQNRDGER